MIFSFYSGPTWRFAQGYCLLRRDEVILIVETAWFPDILPADFADRGIEALINGIPDEIDPEWLTWEVSVEDVRAALSEGAIGRPATQSATTQEVSAVLD